MQWRRLVARPISRTSTQRFKAPCSLQSSIFVQLNGADARPISTRSGATSRIFAKLALSVGFHAAGTLSRQGGAPESGVAEDRWRPNPALNADAQTARAG